MTLAWAFAIIAMGLAAAAVRLFRRGWQRRSDDRVMARLGAGQAQVFTRGQSWMRLERTFLRAGLGKPSDYSTWWLVLWVFSIALGLLLAGWTGLLVMLLLPPLGFRLYISWRYKRRVRRMVAQLPPFLDHTVRSLKAGRSLADAVLNGIEASADPLQAAMLRVRRSVNLGVSLPEAMHDLAELYEQDELRILALGLGVNHRYGGNASELLENLISMIREREQGARELRAMTGETRLTAVVLATLPLLLVGIFLGGNPTYLLSMWEDPSGQRMLLSAFALQVIGCFALWRMLRSI